MLVSNGTPKPIIERLHAELVKAIRSPEVRSRLVALGAEVVTMRPEEQDTFFNKERARWLKVVTEASIKID